jgi:hypothetical protein
VAFNQLLHALATEGRIEIDDESEIVLAAYNESFGAIWPENPGVDHGDPMWEGVAITFDLRYVTCRNSDFPEVHAWCRDNMTDHYHVGMSWEDDSDEPVPLISRVTTPIWR